MQKVGELLFDYQLENKKVSAVLIQKLPRPRLPYIRK